MFKFIGVIAVLGSIGVGLGEWYGVWDIKTEANLTPKGHEQVQQARNNLAESIRGNK